VEPLWQEREEGHYFASEDLPGMGMVEPHFHEGTQRLGPGASHTQEGLVPSMHPIKGAQGENTAPRARLPIMDDLHQAG